MRLGLNQNITHKGETYHIQTEDGGRGNPIVTSILFKDGLVLASKKTSYADIVKSDKLDAVVREIMNEQHNFLLKALKTGRFEGRAAEKSVQPRAEGRQVESALPKAEESLDDIILERLSLNEKDS